MMIYSSQNLNNTDLRHDGSAPIGGKVRRITLIGNFLPRRCGMATFTTDVYLAFTRRFPHIAMDIWAMNDAGNRYDYPAEVSGSIDADEIESYRVAAREIVASTPDLVWIQHEFGIFGGPAGTHLLTLIDRLSCPVAATLHTVLSNPDPEQRRVIEALVARCQTLIVMADEGRRLLIDIYGADMAKIVVIPHGIPDRPFAPTLPMKRRLGLEGKDVILTFGLLSIGKGIETIIEALPACLVRSSWCNASP
jgi:glycosyltransferase involved in cell wall biosynthesis